MTQDTYGFRGLHGRLHRQTKAARGRDPRSEKINRAAMASPPGSDLAKARIAAHAAFDPFWQSGRFPRSIAYEWLASEMGLPVDRTHMILFDVAQCQRVVEICRAHPLHAQLVAHDFEDLDK